ncbi:MAG: cell division protein FtsH, partial [Firmicutes bacterium]|nr:cell division protein FtsH [Bacillota bacterium]
AEMLVLKEISTGAQNDLERATEIARKMVMEYGMSEELGPLTLGRKQDTPFLGRDLARDRNYSEEVAYAIDQEVRKIIDKCYQRARNLLEENLSTLHLVAGRLMEKETLEAEEFNRLMEGVRSLKESKEAS